VPERSRTWALCVWLTLWAAGTAAAVVLTTPWEWLPGGSLPATDPGAGLGAATLDRIADYRDTAVPVGLATTALGLLVSALLGLTPLGARLVSALPGRRRRWAHRVVAVAVLLAVGLLATLPMRVAGEHLARRAGLSTRTWGSWAADVATSYAVATVVTSAALVSLAAMATHVRRWEWLASLGAGALVLIGSLAYPVVIEPLYASFTPMQAGPQRTSLVELAARDGIDVDQVLVADASKRTSALNAYVSGFGPTRRIVVYDTLLQQAPPREVRLIAAHEIGHAASDDVWRGTLIGSAAGVAGTTALTLLAGSSMLRRRSGLAAAALAERHASAAGAPREPPKRDAHRRREAPDPARHTVTAVAGVPLLLALSALGSFAVLPLTNVVSRAIEARADLHALQLTDDPAGFVAMQRRLAATNLSDPSPPAWRQLWFGTHPSPAQRIALARGWTRLLAQGHPEPNLLAQGHPEPNHGRPGAVAQSGAGTVEQPARGATESEHRQHDHRRDQRHQQAVLDGGCSAVVAGCPGQRP
jgi:STE24 endopeptidase